MTSINQSVSARPARRVRLIENAGVVVAFPEPHHTPILPGSWGPLSREQQDAVQRACDHAPDCLIFKLESIWEPGTEYRVYKLATEHWAGLSVVCKYVATTAGATGRNEYLLGLAWELLSALKIATDFFNWDLEVHGQHWRLSAHDA